MKTSAKHVAEAIQIPPRVARLTKVYWNQTRMGGRDLDELPRNVTLDDALAAIGLPTDAAAEDAAAIAFLRDVEQANGIALPSMLRRFLTRRGVPRAVQESHPNSPHLVPLNAKEWRLVNPRPPLAEGTLAVTLMEPHQGSFAWVAAFRSGDADAQVYIAPGDPTDEDDDAQQRWALTAPSVGLFFWDLAQTGLAWYQYTMFKGGKLVRRTDIGLVPDT